VLNRLVRCLFIFGVVLGLAGQGVASASTPCMAMMQRQVTAMDGMSDCMAGQDKPVKQSAPCKEMMPGCLAMSGCAVLAALDGPSAAVHEPQSGRRRRAHPVLRLPHHGLQHLC
jgi:hypothetical protein